MQKEFFNFKDKIELTKREKYLIRIGLIFGSLIGIALGIMIMYSLHLIGWY